MNKKISETFRISEWLTAAVAIAALTLSITNFAIQQADRRAKAAEDVPLIGFNFEFPSSSEAYGFFLENRGNKRAHIEFYELFTVNESYSGEAQSLLDQIGFSSNESFVPRLGPNYSMPSGGQVQFYTFTKELSDSQADIFLEYVTKIKAEICYCNSSGNDCSIHIVSVVRDVIEQGPETTRVCEPS